MPKIVISGVAHVFVDDPNSDEFIVDDEVLAILHGMHSEDVCFEYFDEPPLSELVAGGGRLRFVHDEENSELRITTAYDLSRNLTEDEQALLVEATIGQWSDGIGSGAFRCYRGEVMSTTLGMVLQGMDPENIEEGSLFVDAYPFVDDRDLQIEIAQGRSDDELVNELIAAAKDDDVAALMELAQRTEAGDGIKQDDVKARKMYAKAASLGDDMAAVHLGNCLLEGKGIEQDFDSALQCFHAAAEAGNPLGMAFIGECYSEGHGVEVDPEQAFYWYREGAKTGDGACLAELANCFEVGKGVEPDFKMAYKCYKAAIEAGFDVDEVQEALERVKGLLEQ